MIPLPMRAFWTACARSDPPPTHPSPLSYPLQCAQISSIAGCAALNMTILNSMHQHAFSARPTQDEASWHTSRVLMQ